MSRTPFFNNCYRSFENDRETIPHATTQNNTSPPKLYHKASDLCVDQKAKDIKTIARSRILSEKLEGFSFLENIKKTK